MQTKKIAIINGHPDDKSFCTHIANYYYKGAKDANLQIKIINIRELKFNPNLEHGYNERMPLEEDLIEAQETIKWCTHLVIVTPVWWGGLPALFKGFLDRVLLRDFSHRFVPGKLVPEKLLKGRSATVLYTQGSPQFLAWLFLGDAFWKVLKNYILNICGFSPIKRYVFDKVKSKDDTYRQLLLQKIYALGQLGA